VVWNFFICRHTNVWNRCQPVLLTERDACHLRVSFVPKYNDEKRIKIHWFSTKLHTKTSLLLFMDMDHSVQINDAMQAPPPASLTRWTRLVSVPSLSRSRQWRIRQNRQLPKARHGAGARPFKEKREKCFIKTCFSFFYHFQASMYRFYARCSCLCKAA